MDRRKVKTVKAIRAAFARLLTLKRYSEITVQDILDEADVGRSTFYEHYKTKDELLHSVLDEIFAHVFSHDLSPETHHDFSGTHDYEHVLVHMFYHFAEDQGELKGILRSESKDIFVADLKTHLQALVYDYIFTVYRSDKFDEGLLVDHLINTLTSLTLWWLDRDCKEPPEEVTKIYFGLILPVLA